MKLMFAIGFLLGIIVGIYLSPVKKGINVTNYNQCENLENRQAKENKQANEKEKVNEQQD
ncbi:MAG: hypothetical protein FWH20_05180 [Oscillospiraceae bacterium]|nr:hypothetical protein [Oscillospiraceae bacterium]